MWSVLLSCSRHRQHDSYQVKSAGNMGKRSEEQHKTTKLSKKGRITLLIQVTAPTHALLMTTFLHSWIILYFVGTLVQIRLYATCKWFTGSLQFGDRFIPFAYIILRDSDILQWIMQELKTRRFPASNCSHRGRFWNVDDCILAWFSNNFTSQIIVASILGPQLYKIILFGWWKCFGDPDEVPLAKVGAAKIPCVHF